MPGRAIVVVLLASLGLAHANCPNQCSGHGTCGKDDLCQCFKDWGMGDEEHGDCSQRICPYEIAFVDRPDKNGFFHTYMECSGKGVCDRTTGSCECFDGYTGKGCQRSGCHNGCSGHGNCEHMYMLSYGPVPGAYDHALDRTGISTDAETFSGEAARLWDDGKYMVCVCDGGWTELDCSKRMCPKGNDVMDERLNMEDAWQPQVQNITLYAAGASGNGTSSTINEFFDRSFAFTFVSTMNETFSTRPIWVDEYSANFGNLTSDIELALKGLPNRVVDNVDVNVTFGYENRATWAGASEDYVAFFNIQVAFTGMSVQGDQNMLIANIAKCEDGCNPKVTGFNVMSATNNGDLSYVRQLHAADFNNFECGRRGKCNYDTGMCECFTGFTGDACNLQTALL